MLPWLWEDTVLPSKCLSVPAVPVCSMTLEENSNHFLFTPFLLSIFRFSSVPSVQECFLKEPTHICLFLIQEIIMIFKQWKYWVKLHQCRQFSLCTQQIKLRENDQSINEDLWFPFYKAECHKNCTTVTLIYFWKKHL